MRIISVAFRSSKDSTDYIRLNKVFVASTKYHNPNSSVESYEIETVKFNKNKKYSFTSNTYKLDKWVKLVENSDDPEIILSDSDMMCRGDMSDGFNNDFDIAYTIRQPFKDGRLPFNGGIIYLRKNERTIEFLKKWREINNKMYESSSFHSQYRKKYGGINQAAMGYMLNNHSKMVKLAKLQCETYNSCDINWKNALRKAKMIHIKGRLRKYILNSDPNRKMTVRGNVDIGKIVKVWKEWEKEIKQGNYDEWLKECIKNNI